MNEIIFYIFCGMCLGGALGVLMLPNYVNATMSMLVSMLGVAGLLLLLHAYFLALVMVTVYAGAVLVLFVFVAMLIGDEKDSSGWIKKCALLAVWLALGAAVAKFSPEIVSAAPARAASDAVPVLAVAKNYGLSLFTDFMLPLQTAGALLLAAITVVITIAKPNPMKRQKKEELQ